MARSSSDPMRWELSPDLPNGARIHSTSSGGGNSGSLTLDQSESVWFSPGAIVTNYTLKATHINYGGTNISDTATLYVKEPNLGIWRNGARLDTATARDSGSITRILNPHRDETPGTGREHGISLKLDPAGIPGATPALTYELRLKSISDARNTGRVRVYDGESLVLENPAGGSASAVLTENQLTGGGDFWLEFERGGIVELELAVLSGSSECCVSQPVRASGIACDPFPGSLLFVNPSGTVGSPYNDFTRACSDDIATALSVASSGQNVLVAGATYDEWNLTVPEGVLLAGLGAAFDPPPSDPDDYEPTGFIFTDVPKLDPVSNPYTLLNMEKESSVCGFNIYNGYGFAGGGMEITNKNVTVCYVKFVDNEATWWGGAVYLRGATNAWFEGCEFIGNKVDYDDYGTATYHMGMGGAIAARQSTLTVTNCLFKNNLAQVSNRNNPGKVPTGGSAGGGGDIYLRQGDLTLLNSCLQNATAGIPRDAEPVDPDKPKEYFTGDGGSLLIHGEKKDTKLTIRDCKFIGSQSYGNGGAISLSKDSSPDGRTYFVIEPGWSFPLPINSHPAQLGGGCEGVISNVTFASCLGGWQGGAISANGRGMELLIIDSVFEECHAGTSHLRDGKGGAIAVGGGLQSYSAPVNNVEIRGHAKRSTISGCSASGNGGGVYVTIKGKVTLSKISIENCLANDLATEPMVEGMGGGIHVSAGGDLYLNGTPNEHIEISGNTAKSNGGGLSVKSGRIIVDGNSMVTIKNNNASGSAINGYGNGGGVFVTTSRHDDNLIDWPPGAGNGAAIVFNEDGKFFSSSSNLTIMNNAASRWGGGLYAGISHPWYYIGTIWPYYNIASLNISLTYGKVSGNGCEQDAMNSPSYKPMQIAAECVAGYIGGAQASLIFDNATIIGGGSLDHIGIYTYQSRSVSANDTEFLFVVKQTLEE